MHLKFTALLFFLLLISFTEASAQTSDSGYVYMRVFGSKYPYCKLDSLHFSSSDTTLTAAPGKHRLQFWLPTAYAIDTTVTVHARDTVECSFMLERSKAYTKYEDAYFDYRRLRNKRYFISPIWAGFTIGTGLIIGQVFAQKQYDLAINAKTEYSRRGNQNAQNVQKDIFNDHRKKYDNLKKVEYSVYGVAGLVMVNYVRILIKQSHIKVPVYNETNPLAKLNVEVYPTYVNRSVQCSLSIHF